MHASYTVERFSGGRHVDVHIGSMGLALGFVPPIEQMPLSV
jgi:hypothetical protein